MPDFIQYAFFMAAAAMLFLLRVDGRRFRAAEWDDDRGDLRAWVSRLAWYLLGLALVLLVFALHPAPISQLHLDLGTDRGAAILLGIVYGAGGTVLAFLVAWSRYGRLRLPEMGRYPGAAITSLLTALIDEALFRGVVLGVLLSLDLQTWAAVLVAALIYAGTIRAAGGGRGLLMLLLTFGVGMVSGGLTVQTDGIGAGLVGLAITRFTLFLATGHRGRVRPPGFEREEMLATSLPPTGWGRAGARGQGGGRHGPGPRLPRR